MKNRATLSYGAGFWIVALAFLIAMAFCTVPTPLYLIYQRQDGFATYMITIIFAAYAVGVVMSLYFAGHVSDWLGRRTIILAAVGAEIISGLLFLFWHPVAGLLVARLLSGLGIGALTATATAHLAELRKVSHPGEDGSRAALVATIVNTGGLALGPPVSGLLAQLLPAPLVVPYALFVVLLLAGVAAVLFVPETVARPAEPPAYRPQRLSVAGEHAPRILAAGVGVLAGFAITGMFGSLAPSFMAKTMHESSRFIAGLVSGSVFASATLAQVGLARAGRRVQLLTGLLSMSAGLLLIALSMLFGSLALFLAASVSSGVGTGLILRSSIATAQEVARDDNRGGVLAVVFLLAYVGLALPVIGLGLLLVVVSSTPAIFLFSGVILLLVLWSGTRMFRALETVPAESDA